MRYVSKNRHVYQDSHCLICGDCYGVLPGAHRLHAPATCTACGTVQCHPCLSDRCAVCYIGRLDSGYGVKLGTCQYKGCTAPAIAEVDGANRRRCRAHVERGKWAGHIAKRLTERATQFDEVDDTRTLFPVR
jgi:hypothetical protein